MSQLKGILPLLKPPGLTSHDCVAKLRRILRMKRIGHTGTLDPSVTGVLPICIGQATRVVEYLQELPKEYVGAMVLGKATNTEDADGNVIEDKTVESALSEESVLQALSMFWGEIEQIPPMFSAVKVNGTRLHKLAREGKEVERAARTVEIYELEPLAMSLQPPYPEITLRVKCSKGTYVRTLFVDIGKKLGYPAHMKNLQRTASEPFKLRDCYTFEEIEAAVEEHRIQELLKPLDFALTRFPSLTVSERDATDILNGKKIRLSSDFPDGEMIRMYGPEQRFLALYRVIREGTATWGKADKVFRDT